MKFLEKELSTTASGDFVGEMRKHFLEGRPEVNIERMKQFWERKLHANQSSLHNAPAPPPQPPK